MQTGCVRWSVLSLTLLVACAAAVEDLEGLGGGNGGGNGSGSGNGQGMGPNGEKIDPTREIIVILESARQQTAYVVVHDARGGYLESRRMVAGDVAVLEIPNPAMITLLELENDGTCYGGSTIDEVRPGSTLTFRADAALEETFIADFEITLADYNPGVRSRWVGIGCDGEVLDRNERYYRVGRACVVKGHPTDVVDVGYDEDGFVVGWSRVRMQLEQAGTVRADLGVYTFGSLIGTIEVANPPPDATAGTLVLRGLGNSYTTQSSHAFNPSLARADVRVSMTEDIIPVRASLEYVVRGQTIVTALTLVDNFYELPDQLVGGGAFPVISNAFLTARERPVVGSQKIGPTDLADGALVSVIWDAQTTWEMRTPKVNAASYQFPQLPDQLATCRPGTTSPRTNLTLFDSRDGKAFDTYVMGQPLDELASRYTTFSR